jgi:hypothetical protein
MNSAAFSNYISNAYKGPAARLGAGVQAFQPYTDADKVGLNIVDGQCPTVDIAGGY